MVVGMPRILNPDAVLDEWSVFNFAMSALP